MQKVGLSGSMFHNDNQIYSLRINYFHLTYHGSTMGLLQPKAVNFLTQCGTGKHYPDETKPSSP